MKVRFYQKKHQIHHCCHWNLPLSPIPSPWHSSAPLNCPKSQQTLLTPTTTQHIQHLKLLAEKSNSLEEVKQICYQLADTVGTALTDKATAQETVRQLTTTPKKSKTDKRQISKARVLSRTNLDRLCKLHLEQEREKTKTSTQQKAHKSTCSSKGRYCQTAITQLKYSIDSYQQEISGHITLTKTSLSRNAKWRTRIWAACVLLMVKASEHYQISIGLPQVVPAILSVYCRWCFIVWISQ